MGTVWYAVVIFSSFGLCHRTDSETGLRYAYTVTMQADKIACFGAGYVDGESFLQYSSDNIHHPATWLTTSNIQSEKVHFGKRCVELKAEFHKMMNASTTTGMRTLQISTECTLEMDTTLVYNGDTIKTFSLNDTQAQGCSYRLRIYRNLMFKDVKPPHVNVERRLLHHSQSAKLRCTARDFYPAGLHMHWCPDKNNTSPKPIVDKNLGPLPQGDGLYRKYIEIIVKIGEEHLYVCKIHGVATKNSIRFLKWEQAVSDLSDSSAFLLALFLPAFAAIIIIVFGFVWHRQDEIRPTRVPGRSSNSTSGQHVGRRAAPFANTAV